MSKNFHFLSVALLGLISLGIIAGCEHETRSSGFSSNDSSVPVDKNKDKKDKPKAPATNNFVGTWKLTAADGASWYAFFEADGSWKICDTVDGPRHVYGSYTVKNGTLNGDMVNPKVGTGSIAATISNGVMAFDFIEHWHNPYKTVHYKGSKL